MGRFVSSLVAVFVVSIGAVAGPGVKKKDSCCAPASKAVVAKCTPLGKGTCYACSNCKYCTWCSNGGKCTRCLKSKSKAK